MLLRLSGAVVIMSVALWVSRVGLWVSQAKLAPLHMSPAIQLQSTRHNPLPPPPWLIPKAKPTYAQVTKKPLCDPEKGARDTSHDQTGSKLSHDPACDPRKEPPDQPRDWLAIQSCALPRFGRVMRLLIGTWKTMGRINNFTEEITKTCFSLMN